MRKNIILIALFLGISLTTFAHTGGAEGNSVSNQETSNYNTEDRSFWSNTFVSAGIGGQMAYGDHDIQRKFGELISPALDVAVGKWLLPELGVRLMYSGWSLNGATQTGSLGNGKPISNKPWHGYWLYEQEMKYTNLHADFMFNLHNFFGKNKADRLWNCIPYAGLGWIHFNDPVNTNNMSANLGLLNTFCLTKALDLNLDIRGVLVQDDFDAEAGGRSSEGILGVTVGVSYKFNAIRKK